MKKKHKIFSTVHHSPLSAHNGFFGSGVFGEITKVAEVVW
jgi:uracil DNA glycosylase